MKLCFKINTIVSMRTITQPHADGSINVTGIMLSSSYVSSLSVFFSFHSTVWITEQRATLLC